MTRLESLILKFLATALEDKVSDPKLFDKLKEEALRQYNAQLISATDHCDIEAWIDLKQRNL